MEREAGPGYAPAYARLQDSRYRTSYGTENVTEKKAKQTTSFSEMSLETGSLELPCYIIHASLYLHKKIFKNSESD